MNIKEKEKEGEEMKVNQPPHENIKSIASEEDRWRRVGYRNHLFNRRGYSALTF